MLLRPLYESWLLRSTAAPLAPWQRRLLLRALRRDETLRCLAAELAQFSHGDTPAGLKAPDLRSRLRHLAPEPPASERPWQPGWVLAGATVVVLATVLDLWVPEPHRQSFELAQVQQDDVAEALRLPSLTPTPTVTPTPTPGPEPAADKVALP